MFDVVVKNINDNVDINVITIDNMTPEFKTFLDNNLISIYLGAREISLTLAKKKLFKFLKTKSHDIKMGAIAEFFIHLYIMTLNFKQECLMSNLEEGSIKKGFDGYYSQDEIEWIMESKSGTIKTNKISHHAKVKEAYNGLKSLLSGGSNNNPWENAYNHASHRDVNTRDSIIKNIQKFSDEFDENIYYEIDNFNIIPSATIFYDGQIAIDIDSLLDKIESSINEFKFQKLKVICVSKQSIDLFLNYLQEGNV